MQLSEVKCLTSVQHLQIGFELSRLLTIDLDFKINLSSLKVEPKCLQDLGHRGPESCKRSTFMGAKKNHAKKILIFSSLAALLMGADQKGCEQQQAVSEPRKLKKLIQMDEIRVAPLLLKNEEYDFEFQLNEEIKVAVADSDFYVRKVMPGQELGNHLANGDDGFFQVEKMSNGKMGYKLSGHQLGLDEMTLKQMKAWDPNFQSKAILVDTNIACLISRPQYDLSVAVNSLELSSGGKVHFGFGSLNIPLTDLSFGLDKSIMNFTIHSWDGLRNEHITSLPHAEPKTDYETGLKIQLGPINIGPQFYKKTGLQEVTRKGLKNTLAKMAKALKEDVWSSRVLTNNDRTITFTGGKELNIKNGDIFYVYEPIILTNGNQSACNSSNIIISENKGDYVWEVEVIDAGNGASRAKVLNPIADLNIQPGFKVELSKRIEDIQAQLAQKKTK